MKFCTNCGAPIPDDEPVRAEDLTDEANSGEAEGTEASETVLTEEAIWTEAELADSNPDSTAVVKTNPKDKNAELTDRELLEKMAKRLDYLEKKEKGRTVKNWITFGVVVAVLACLAFFLVPKIQAVVTRYNELTDQVAEIGEKFKSIDFDEVKETFNQWKKVDLEKLQDAMGKLGEIDVPKINEIADKLGSIDFQAFFEKMESVLEPLSKIGSWFK